ncbi:hypothetical protein QBC46DRAFT_33593 [Diplogelasinospora grovesii]|uniref:Uncharacterized protein n=1 Tax=Diplogelasinospora grovesii TaxID=303347 RepID=A0AAN6NCW9_9PEZI|nr:hypothetical protein QBC46DRAFT_33593 [Diplogelasinospora grovesii]
MLTINKPAQYGYRSVHDLPTPPSTSRPSPPLSFQDSGQKPPFAIPRSNSPSNQPMSAPHRGLPPPAAMTLAQPPPPVSGPPQSSASQSLGQAPPPPPPSQSLGSQNSGLGQFPAAPSWQHVTEESMRTWLMAKAEEEKRKQEEEKTRQESYRLEQRRMEHDILRTSLQGGIPPPMVPVVFAGMGGGVLSQAALEWAQQYMYPQSQQSHAPALMPPGPISPEHHHRRDSQAPAYAPYQASTGVPSTPGSAQGPPSGYMSAYPPSPTRPRGQSMPGHMAGGRPPPAAGSHLPSLNTNVPGGGPGGGPGMAVHPGIAQSQREESQPSPSIYFHHWQPPTSQAGGRGGADQPATPSGESPRKRKATGPQPAAPPPSSSQRLRSPPFSHSTGLSNPPPGRRRGHSRQRSDLGGYRAAGAGRGRGESLGPQREASPMPSRATGPGPSRDSGEASSSQLHQQHQQSQQQAPSRSGAQSVSSLLSDNPPSPQATQYASGAGLSSDMRSQPGEGERRSAGAAPHRSSEGKTRGGAAGSAATRERDDD